MEIYRVNCKNYTEKENTNVRKTKKYISVLLSNCAVCGKKKSTFKKIKNFN